MELEIAEIPSYPFRCTIFPGGPYTVGCADIMIGKDKDGSLFRLYYPTSLPNIKSQPTNSWTRLFLGEKYCEGWSKNFFPYFSPIFKMLSNKMLGNALVPAVWEAQVADKKFPVVLFSHGLLANRSLYSCICTTIASYGLIVAAIEHRDGSACASFTLSADGIQDWLICEPIGPNENEFNVRKKQIEIRASECRRALDVLERLSKGDKLKNEFSSSKFDLESLKGKLDMSSPIMAGHSFGGATACLVLAQDSRFKGGIHQHQVDSSILFWNEYVIVQKFIDCYSSAFAHPELPMTLNNAMIMKFILKHLNVCEEYQEVFAKFLSKHHHHVIDAARGTAEFMIGWMSLPDSELP